MEMQEIQGKLEGLNKKLVEMKTEVHNTIHRQHVNFLPRLKTSEALSDNVDGLSEEMTEVGDKIENEVMSNKTLCHQRSLQLA
jgi:hypothetical protein